MGTKYPFKKKIHFGIAVIVSSFDRICFFAFLISEPKSATFSLCKN